MRNGKTAATALGVDLGARAAMMCLLEEIGGTEGMTAALEAGAEGSLIALILAVTGCDLETEEGDRADSHPGDHHRPNPGRPSRSTTAPTGGTGSMRTGTARTPGRRS